MFHFLRQNLFNAALLFALACVANSVMAQPATISKQQAKNLLLNYKGNAITKSDVSGSIVTDAYPDMLSGAQIIYLQQTVLGVPVYNTIKSLAVKEGEIRSSAGRFIVKPLSKIDVADARPSTTLQQAFGVAAASLQLQTKQAPTFVSSGLKFAANLANLSDQPITAKLLWVPQGNKLKLCWQIGISPLHSPDYWLINVSAVNNSIISKDNLNISEAWNAATGLSAKENNAVEEQLISSPEAERSINTVSGANYRVIPFPFTNIDESGGVTQLISNPWEQAGSGNAAVTLGWHNDGIVSHDSTRGNNVWAREDTAGDNGQAAIGKVAKSTTPSPNLNFDFPFDATVSPYTSNNQKFAITQLFYWNNIMHDIVYQYGFNEAAGNFQNSNLNRGGLGQDYVIADVQDGSGRNNANFNTPEDGMKPRMQMFLWSGSTDKLMEVKTPVSIAGYKRAVEGAFSNANLLVDVGPVTGDVALYASPTENNNLACTSVTGEPLKGKIALITRGSCTFVQKVANAQRAGAIAAIVVNTSDTLITMSGNDNSITIPAVFVGATTGDAIRAAIQAGQKVSVTLRGAIDIDGDLDNGIVAHEYAHGISNRLTGGPAAASCLVNKEQMGEGWSDYYALMTTTDWSKATVNDGPKPRPVGTYVLSESLNGAGIRHYPYSTDPQVNPLTYAALAASSSGESHNIGEVWAETLWDMTWNIIQTDGINPNLYNASAAGGNSVSMKLVTEGLKLQPCLPGFLDGRDAILMADTLLYNGRYSCAIWKAFAAHGMGLFARQGSSDNYGDQVADYYPNSVIISKSANRAQASQNEEITYTISATCKCGPLQNVTITDTLPSNVTYLSGGTYSKALRTVSYTIPTLQSGTSASFNVSVKVNPGTYYQADTLLNEPVPPQMPATFSATTTTAGARWTVSSARSHSGAFSFKALDTATNSLQVLTSTRPLLVRGLSTLSFWHYFNTEETYDGGSVEIKAEGDSIWHDAADLFIKNGYNSPSAYGPYNFFSGNSGGFIESAINLSTFNNKNVYFRFVFATDEAATEEGWYIDDILLKNEAGVYNLATLFASGNKKLVQADTITLINAITLPVAWNKFLAQKANTKVLLTWSTEQESNTANFTIERSSDGQTFNAIGSSPAAGYSATARTYTFTDELPINGLNYYRIRQSDSDGHFTYSEIRQVDMGSATLLVVSPNPAQQVITISLKGNTGKTFIQLISADGKQAGGFWLTGESAQFNIGKYPSGVYLLKQLNESSTQSIRLVINRLH